MGIVAMRDQPKREVSELVDTLMHAGRPLCPPSVLYIFADVLAACALSTTSHPAFILLAIPITVWRLITETLLSLICCGRCALCVLLRGRCSTDTRLRQENRPVYRLYVLRLSGFLMATCLVFLLLSMCLLALRYIYIRSHMHRDLLSVGQCSGFLGGQLSGQSISPGS